MKQRNIRKSASGFLLSFIMALSVIPNTSLNVFAEDETPENTADVFDQTSQGTEENAEFTTETIESEQMEPLVSEDSITANDASDETGVSGVESRSSNELSISELFQYVENISLKKLENGIWVEIGNHADVYHGDEIEATLSWTIPGDVYKNNKVFTYQLPKYFNISSAITEDIKQGSNKIGTMNVATDGKVTFTYLDSYNTNNDTTVNSMGIRGSAQLVTLNEGDENAFLYTHSSVDFNVINPSDFSVKKSAVKRYEGDGYFNTAYIDYTVVVSSELGTIDTINLTDIFKVYDSNKTEDYASQYETIELIESSLLVKDANDANITGWTSSINQDNHTIAINNLPKLEKKDFYTITYTVKLVEKDGFNASVKAVNYVSATSKNHQGEDITKQAITEVEFTQKLRKQAGSNYSRVDGLRWTIRVSTNGLNLAGYVVKDNSSMPIKYDSRIRITGQKSDGSYVVHSDSAYTKISENEMEIKIPQTEKWEQIAEWVITYNTRPVDFAEGETERAYSNTATLETLISGGPVYTVGVPGTVKNAGIVTPVKSVEEGFTKNQDGTYQFHWNIDISFTNVTKDQIQFYDLIRDAEYKTKNEGGSTYDSWSSVYAQDHYANLFTLDAEVKNSLRFTLNDGRVLTYEEMKTSGFNVYIEYYEETSWKKRVTNLSQDTRVRIMNAIINRKTNTSKDLAVVNIKASYTTLFDTKDYVPGQEWRLQNSLYCENVEAKAVAAVKEEPGSISKEVKDYKNSTAYHTAWTKADQTFAYSDVDGKLTYRLLISVPEGQDEIIVKDTLPEGMSISAEGYTGNGNSGAIVIGSSRGTSVTTYTWYENDRKDSIDVIFPTEENNNTITFKIANLGTKLPVSQYVWIQYTAEFEKDLSTLSNTETNSNGMLVSVSHTFTNNVSFNGSSTSQNTTIYQEEQALTKTGAQVINEDGSTSSQAKYTIIINPKGLDLVEASEVLTLTDIITSTQFISDTTGNVTSLTDTKNDLDLPLGNVKRGRQNTLDFELIRDSIKLHSVNEDGTKGEEVEPLSLHADYVQTSDQGDIYQKFVMSIKDQTPYILEYEYQINNAAAKQAGTLNNLAAINGVALNTAETQLVNISAWATSDHASLTIKKVDAENNTKYLPNAEFKLEALNKEKGTFEAVIENFQIKDGKEGKVFEYFDKNAVLKGNTLYRIVETKAPAGYVLSTTPKYFIIKGNIEDVRATSDQTSLVIVDEETARTAAFGAITTVEENGAAVDVSALSISMLEPDKGAVIDFSNVKAPFELTVTKNWVGPVGTSVNIHVYANGKEVKSDTLSEANNWTVTYSDLEKYDDDFNEITYTVDEETVVNYSKKIEGNTSEGFTITNTNTETTSVSVEKKWEGPAADMIHVQLLRDGSVYKTVTLNAADNWTYRFVNLEKYSKTDGHAYVYTVDEVNLDNYTSKITGSESEGFTITNSNIETTSVSVEKKWIGASAEAVTMNLYADGNKVEEKTVTVNDQWRAVFSNLKKYNADGSEIVYTVDETAIAGYSSSVEGNQNDGYIITNTNDALVDVKVNKKWVGTPADAVEIQLMKNGVFEDSITLNPSNNWTHAFTGLRKYDALTGAENVYTVNEASVEGYTSVITGDQASGFTVTNTITGKVSVGVTKKWLGEPAEKITVNLYGNEVQVDTKTITAEDNWAVTFEELEQYDTEGKEISYTVQEEEIEGYSTSIVEKAKNTFEITNTNLETIIIHANKKWIGPAAEAVTFNLLADGEMIDSRTVTANDSWTTVFENLPKFSHTTGNAIQYAVVEEELEGYSSESAVENNTYTFTNTNDAETSVNVEKKWFGPKTSSVEIVLLKDGESYETIRLNDANNWAYTFENLRMYDAQDGHEIVYTVAETEIENYASVIEGNAAEGFTITNTNTETVSFDITKRWEGQAAEFVIIRVYADKAEINVITLSEENGWIYAIENLPKYRADGSEISYIISEDAMENYISEIAGNSEEGFVVTNTRIRRPSVPDTSSDKPEEPGKPGTPARPSVPDTSDAGYASSLLMFVGSMMTLIGAVYISVTRRRKKKNNLS